MANRAVRASSVDLGTSGFADSATFLIPSDVKGGFIRMTSGGRTAGLVNEGALFLYPGGIAAYGSIRSVAWAPDAGRLWVAADAKVDEIDLFKRAPVQTTKVSGLPKRYISRVSQRVDRQGSIDRGNEPVLHDEKPKHG